jgi:putative peptide zinc metalloprotease protein
MENEITITADFVPRLSNKVTFTSFDSKSYLVCIDNDNATKLNISLYTKLLLEQVDGSKTIRELTHEFNARHNTTYTTEQITGIFKSQLVGFGILEDDKEEKILVKDDYLKLRFTLMPQKLVHAVSGFFTPAFSGKTFVVVSLLCSAFLALVFMKEINLSEFYLSITPTFFFIFYCINVISILFHEFGHAAACQRYGAKCGAIGFGFYIFTPVFYADVTDAWRLKRNERLIVDIGGIYMQMIFCTGLVILFYLMGDKTYLFVSFAIASTVLVNINPFLRYDGYWALSDLMNMPNLRARSNASLLKSIRAMKEKDVKIEKTWSNAFLIVYAAVSFVFMVFFFGYMVIYRHDSVIYFPVNLYNFFRTFITTFPDIKFFWVRDNLTSFILPTLFYFVLIKYLWNRIRPKKINLN